MSALEKLEKRLASLEAEVAKLKHEDGTPWWEEWFGAFANDSHFEEAMKLGRKWRESQKPRPKRKRKVKNGRS